MKTFIKAVGMESTKFVYEMLFLFLAGIICTSDGEDDRNFYVRNGLVGTVETTGLLHSFFISCRCSANLSPKRLPVSPM